MVELDITEVASMAGLPASTLRYYEERGLICSIGRRGLKRTFASSVLQRLALVALGRAAGFSLDEIARMVPAEGGPRVDRQMLQAKADEIDRRIRELERIRDGLRHAVACRASTAVSSATVGSSACKSMGASSCSGVIRLISPPAILAGR